MEAISSALTNAKSPSTPSIKTKADVLFAEENPRIRIPEVSLPGCPLERKIVTPGICPCSAEIASVAGWEANFEPSIAETDPERLTFFCEP